MKIGLFGRGKMGKMVEALALQENLQVADPLESDVCIDFSHAGSVEKHVLWAIKYKKPLVIGTTGWEDNLQNIKQLVLNSEIAVLHSPNFSLGIAIFKRLLVQAGELLANYESAGIEFHHSQKKDAPSGTAKEIAQTLHMKIPFASVRCGNIVGKHEVLFASPTDSITLIHEAHSREGFASGALKAAAWIVDKKGWFTLDDMLRSIYGPRYAL